MTNTKYVVYAGYGAAGNFLSAIVAKFLGNDIALKFSKSGDAHDMGAGTWNGTPDKFVNAVGDYWKHINLSSTVFYVHCGPIKQFKKENNNVIVILIEYDLEDYFYVAQMFACKAAVVWWSLEEYNKWAGPDWPPYDKQNIQKSVMVKQEVTNGLIEYVAQWMQDCDRSVVDYTINFKTIMGLDTLDLATEISTILKCPITNDIKNTIIEYQTLNKKLYFNEYFT
jgi:hypothetical protein